MSENSHAELPLSTSSFNAVPTDDSYRELLIKRDRDNIPYKSLLIGVCTVLEQSFPRANFQHVKLVDINTAYANYEGEEMTIELLWNDTQVSKSAVQTLEKLCENEYLFIISLSVLGFEAQKYVNDQYNIDYNAISSKFPRSFD